MVGGCQSGMGRVWQKSVVGGGESSTKGRGLTDFEGYDFNDQDDANDLN